jgi:predicted component of type VI protein secretion system
MPTLTIQLPGFPPVSHVLKDETITIGRMKSNTIVIEDTSISLMHAKITRKSGEFYLKDLNSTNGTIVNGQPVGEVRLRDLDRVRFADISSQFMAEAEVPAQPAVATAAPQLPPRAPSPPPTTMPVPTAPVARPAARPRPSFDLARLPRLAPYFGGLAALTVVSFLGWKFLHLNTASPTTKNEPVLAAATSSRAANELSHPSANPDPTVSGKPNLQSPEPAAPAEETVSHLAAALKAADPLERKRAAETLHSLGPKAKEASDALREALQDPEQEVRMWAALTLISNQSYDKAAIPVLVKVLQHENAVLRQVACLSLGLIPYEAAEKDIVVPALAETAGKDTDEEVRKAALSALSIIAPDIAGKTAAN